jgi:hypothetical protein
MTLTFIGYLSVLQRVGATNLRVTLSTSSEEGGD